MKNSNDQITQAQAHELRLLFAEISAGIKAIFDEDPK